VTVLGQVLGGEFPDETGRSVNDDVEFTLGHEVNLLADLLADPGPASRAQ
jgi:hypothetical protein